MAKAQLKVSMSGDKESIVNQYAKQLELAKAEMKKQKHVVDRLQNLYIKKFISDEEFQLASDELKTLQLAVESKQAELNAVRSGEKQEEINRLITYIHSIDDELKTIEKQLSDLTITSPFSGYIERSFGIDTLLILTELDRFLVTVPVPVTDESLIDKSSKIIVTIGGNEIYADIIEISNAIYKMGSEDNLLVHALITRTGQTLHPGMITEVKIKGKKINMLPYFANVLN